MSAGSTNSLVNYFLHFEFFLTDQTKVEELLADIQKTYKDCAFVNVIPKMNVSDEKKTVDIELPDFKSLELFDTIHRAHPRLPVIIMTAWEDEALRAKAVARGVSGYFYKPFSDDVFLHAIYTAIAKRKESSASDDAR